jgi:[ribosomal protein S18]-alanine N-acetyltransferase
MSEVRSKGMWPGRVQLRRGWALAHARTWNDQTESIAALRLDRGGDRFLTMCADWLSDQGVTLTRSPALAEAQTALWHRAGFQDHLELVVYERSLSDPFGAPTRRVSEMASPDLSRLAIIDDRAFTADWRVGRGGLEDALDATPTSIVFAVLDDDVPFGFAIVGETAGVAYLQRLAVDPDHAGGGIGSSLVRSACQWARRRGAHTMLLNTQPENLAAAGLYLREGFVALGPRLRVLARTATG